MAKMYSYEYIISFKIKNQSKIDELDQFIEMYNNLINQDSIKPLFSQTYKYDLFPKKKVYKKFKIKNKNAWVPTIPKTNIEKIRKIIRIILNKITEKNYNILIETLICEINKFNTSDVLEILATEIIDKVIDDNNFHNIYIKLCNRIWSLKSWHEDLITIVIDDNNKLYWHKNSMNDNDLNGPFDSENDIRIYTDKYINFRYMLLEILQQKFMRKDEYIKDSNQPDINEDLRYKYRRYIFSIIEFIGKLYKKNMISEVIIHLCLLDLINYHKQDDQIIQEYVECFHILWKIIDEKIISPMKPDLANQYFNYIKEHIMIHNWPLRIEFMLDDIKERYEKKYKQHRNNELNKNFTKNNFTRNSISNKQKFTRNNIISKNMTINTNIKNNIIKIKEDLCNNIDEENNLNGKTNEECDDDICDKIENIIYDYKNNNKIDQNNIIRELNKYSENINKILDIIIYISLENPNYQKKYIQLLSKCNFIKNGNIIQALDRAMTHIDDIILDIPNAKNNLLNFIADSMKCLEIDNKNGIINNIIFILGCEL